MKDLLRNENPEEKNPVSARALYDYLGYNTSQWKRWYIKNIVNNKFAIENEDYVGFDIMSNDNETIDSDIMSKTPNAGGRPTMDFAITIDFAKKLSMQAQNEKGEEARNYFIACEKRLKEITQKPLTPAEMFLHNAQLMVEYEQRLSEIEQDVLILKAKTTTRPNYYTIVGYGTLHNISVNLKQASSLGQKASKICKTKGIETGTIPDPRFGKVKMYPESVLDEVFALPIN